MRLKKVRLREASELEPLLSRQLAEVEEGLELIQNQLSLGEPGRPDILAIDAEGALVLIELKADEAKTDALLQALRYRDWLTDNKALLSRVYPRLKPEQAVRVFVAAPDFDGEIRRLAGYLSIPVTFVHVQAVKDEDSGKVALMVSSEEVDQRQESQGHLYSEQDILDYLVEPAVRAELERVLGDLRAIGAVSRPYRAGKYRWLEFLHQGKEIAYVGTLKKAFKSQHFDPEKDDWGSQIVMETYKEWEQKSKPWIVSQMNGVGNGVRA